MSKAIAYILNNASDVTDLVTTVTTLRKEQGENLPYIIIEEEDVVAHDSMTSASTIDEVSFTITAVAKLEYTDTSEGARDILDQVRQTLESTSDGTYNGETVKSIRKEGGVSAFMIQEGAGNVVEAEQRYTMWRTVAQGVTNSVPAVLLTQAAYDALASYDSNTYYLIDNS
ncbi:MAG: tail completion protein gp17 [Lewinella sp.]|uniref:tail completion protein gp17 n=1 Tax=Lewinella sp. TaxID=2004506 RepID=UPI003D6A60B9